MKRLAIIIFDITKQAGTERAVCNLSNLLVESKKYAVSIISLNSTYGKAAFDINGEICIYHLGLPECKNKISRLKNYKLMIRKVDQICNENKIDIIIGTSHAINTLFFLLRKKVRTIGCEHLNYMASPISSRILRKIIYPYLDAIVLLTKNDASHYSFCKNTVIIPNSLSFIQDKRSELTNKVILAIGRLTYQKGFDLLIDAIALIKNECSGWEVRIIGTGEDIDKLERKIRNDKLESIIKIYPPTKNIIQEYQQASIYLMSSRYEGFALVLIEAQACGLPIISFDCPEGPSDIITNNENGFLIDNGNICKMSKALLDLMNNKEKRIKFGENAIINSEKYRSEKIFVLWNDLLGNL